MSTLQLPFPLSGSIQRPKLGTRPSFLAHTNTQATPATAMTGRPPPRSSSSAPSFPRRVTPCPFLRVPVLRRPRLRPRTAAATDPAGDSRSVSKLTALPAKTGRERRRRGTRWWREKGRPWDLVAAVGRVVAVAIAGVACLCWYRRDTSHGQISLQVRD